MEENAERRKATHGLRKKESIDQFQALLAEYARREEVSFFFKLWLI